MDALNYSNHVKIFEQGRMNPSNSEHKIFIEGQIAMLRVTDPPAAENFGKMYTTPEILEEEVVMADTVVETTSEERVTDSVVIDIPENPKKKGKNKADISSPL